MFAVDLHTHSRFYHVGSGPTRYDPIGLRLNAVAARARGVDALAVTNHDYAYSAGTTVPTIPGNEVSTTEGHVLVVGPDPPTRTTPGAWTPAETVERAHERGCAAILAHPFRNSTARTSGAAFDAVELNGKNPEHVARTREFADERGLPLVGGSDAHYPFEVGRAYTVVDVEGAGGTGDAGAGAGGTGDAGAGAGGTGDAGATTTDAGDAAAIIPEAVADAIRDGRVEPALELGPVTRLLDRAYTRSHGSKGWLDAVDR